MRRMNVLRIPHLWLVLSLACAGSSLLPQSLPADDTPSTAADPEGLEFFERKIRPLLAQRCYACHSQAAKKSQGGLQLDTRAAFVAGGDTGPAFVAGKPGESLLIEALGYEGDIQMPPAGKLPAEEIALLTEWVQRGAPLPDDKTIASVKSKIDFDAGRRFWSFQPVHEVAAPAVQKPEWVQRPLDAFLLAAMEQQKLQPAPRADRRTLLRRAKFDLLGLPPTPEELEQFVNDPAPDAYAQLVDRLLASPHYGERWGRYWLDLARYSDKPAPWDTTKAQAWLYRDWVVQAFNDDMPYPEFVRRQLATDQMPGTTPADRAALGFIGLSPVYWKELQLDKEVIKGTVAEEWEERIDALGRTFLGLSLACARCHDHKFDPVSMEDYYALAGVLASTRLIDAPIIPDAEAEAVRQAVQKVAGLQAEIKKLKDMKPQTPEIEQQIGELQTQVAQAEQTPHYHSPLAFGVDDAALYVLANGPNRTKLEYKPGEPLDLNLQIRGNPSNPGPVVPRRFLTVLSPAEPQPFKNGSGRLELAEAIVTTAAPLSARVIVNRVWKQHFGRGLVETASDFGTQGSRPTHPELLTDLTHRFIAHGWSLKWLHRELLLSSAYQQSSASIPAQFAIDPDNRYYWRMTRRRLDVEAWRDAMLQVCGTLDPKLGGPALTLTDPANNRRTLYGSIDRYEVDDMLRLHDFPDAFTHSPHREPTTTALQQLFVLNSPFLQRQSTALAARIAALPPADTPAGDVPDNNTPANVPPALARQIRHLYLLLFSRPPTESELRLGAGFLTAGNAAQAPTPDTWRQYAQVLLGSNEFLFVD